LIDLSGLEEYYPGSRERRHSVSAPAPVVEEDLLGTPVILVLRGLETEFFTIGQVARAIDRKAGTLRGWEANGILPTSGYTKPSHDPRGRRRLYSRPQAEGIIRIAKELGIADSASRTPLDEFGRRVAALFTELRKGAR
jgi:hypothetical protein